MQAKQKLLLALAAVVVGFAANQSAHARDYDGHRHHYKHHYNHHYNHHHKHHYGHWNHHGYYKHGYAVRERVVIERPVYVERYVHYAPPPPRYPAIVLSVDFPPLVIPLR